MLLEPSPGSPEVAPDRDRADGQSPGHILGGQLLHLAQDENGPLALAQDDQGLLQTAAPGGGIEPFGRPGPIVGLPGEVIAFLALAAPAQAAPVIVAGVDRDPIDPAAERLAGAKTVEMAEDPDEDLLGHVLTVVTGDSQKREHPQHARFVMLQELLEGPRITLASRLDERTVPLSLRDVVPLHALPPPAGEPGRTQ